MVQAPEIDLLDPDVFLTDAPARWFAWARRHAPVHRHPEPDGPGFWVVSRHEDVKSVNRQPALFSSDDAYGGPTGLTAADRQRMLDAAKGAKSLPHMDPPEHTAHRRLFARHFQARRVAGIGDRIRKIASDLIDGAVAQGQVDFVHDVAAKFPTQVISEMLGVPEEDRARLFTRAAANFGAQDPEYMADPQDYRDAREEVARYACRLARSRRENPTLDVTNTLAHGEIDGERFPDAYVGLTFDLLIAAGHETVMTTLARGLEALLARPDQLEDLAGDPEGLAGSATEEMLRWATPVRYFRRAAVRDVELGGVDIAAGESVSIWYTSANRDEDVFEDPERFDIRRDPNDHVAFGGGGPHFCLGAHLAKLEIKIFLEELFRRDLDIRGVAAGTQLRSTHFDALKRLPVQFRARRSA